jgi:hypothetical protein
MYYIMYNKTDEEICFDIHQITNKLLEGWKLYGYTDSEQLAYSLLHECKHY